MSDLRQEAVAQSVAFVPQDTSQTFPFTVAETVLLGDSLITTNSWDWGLVGIVRMIVPLHSER
jgi:ABC-type cobalamin/Fe3+-siderophores transport system ATPase subunit